MARGGRWKGYEETRRTVEPRLISSHELFPLYVVSFIFIYFSLSTLEDAWEQRLAPGWCNLAALTQIAIA